MTDLLADMPCRVAVYSPCAVQRDGLVTLLGRLGVERLPAASWNELRLLLHRHATPMLRIGDVRVLLEASVRLGAADPARGPGAQPACSTRGSRGCSSGRWSAASCPIC